ncbi:MAG: D-alanine--D-alanine ligase [Proteobacteria bacterium]|nr:D-alanine--D-alanine ligase [Pseudomonadota bacterium]
MPAFDRRVAVLMGGWTSEAAVSRVSASFCSKAARLAGWDAIEVELDRDIIAKLEDIQPDRVFNALHGQIGEDGSIQGMLNILNIPYTHSGVLASATAMDKISSRLIFASVGIAVPTLLQLEQDSNIYPADYTGAHVIKPRNDGSSVGVVIVKETDSEIIVDEHFYDFDAKYKPGGSRHILPADIPEHITMQACEWAERAFQILGCRGVARADYRWDEEADQLYMLEVNTQPGMTATSLTPEQAAFVGISGEELVNHLLEIAQCDD